MQRQPRSRDEKHLNFIRQLPCCICPNDIQTEAAHVRYACEEIGKRMVGRGEKPDDKWAVPLCGNDHREQHSMSERAWWASKGIDPLKLASELSRVSGDYEAGEQIVSACRERVDA